MPKDNMNRLVEERKRAAEEKDLRRIVANIFDTAADYPKWKKEEPSKFVPEFVYEASGEKPSKENDYTERLTLTVEGGVLEFEFKKHRSYVDDAEYAILALSVDGNSVISLRMDPPNDFNEPINLPWRASEIESYVPGEWEDVILELGTAMKKISDESRTQVEKLHAEVLKKKFGL